MTKDLPLKIVIVDDHEVVRHGLRSLLSLEEDFKIVGEAGTVAEALAVVERVKPQVVLLDVKLPDATGMEACRKLLAVAPNLRVLILTSYAEDASIIGAVQSGAHGYVLKDIRTDELIQAIRAVASGKGHLDPRVAQQALHWIRTQYRTESPGRQGPKLSPQERLIVPLLAQGKTNKEIAAHLSLSDKTVKNYLANIFEKLNVRRRTEAVAWFIREGRSSYSGPNT
ncbi:Transcriptional regulatory protein DevR (DosR) [Nitrospira japonica]|uniref:Transcriptional regulatory protein DevR (DosR) n=1 Tax=Nitrospira japonica TaxID=1325564 RepID=A0A1W1I448_9BACT|nr:response regulator transcription factor [Nitrospira japonica]SLM47780.1 Transcriptional regulatory protein DevR (DosR) [Nitrospira japonica]